MASIVSAYNRVIDGLATLAGLIIAGIFVLIVVDVTMRTAGFSPPALTISTVEYALLYFTMFSAPFLVRNKGHVFIEAFTSILPMVVRRVIANCVYLACMLAGFWFSYVSLQLLIEAIVSGDIDVRGIDMPFWALFLPMPPCFLLVGCEFGRYLAGVDSMYGYDLTKVRDSV